MSLAVPGHGQPGVSVAGGAIVNRDDRMRRIDLGVPAADGAVDRVEDQPGRADLPLAEITKLFVGL